MGPALELTAPAPDEFSLFIEDDNRVGGPTRCMHGVDDVNMALGVFANAVSVSVNQSGRKLTPIMPNLIGVIARTDYWATRARLLAGSENCRHNACRREKSAPVDCIFHIFRS